MSGCKAFSSPSVTSTEEKESHFPREKQEKAPDQMLLLRAPRPTGPGKLPFSRIRPRSSFKPGCEVPPGPPGCWLPPSRSFLAPVPGVSLVRSASNHTPRPPSLRPVTLAGTLAVRQPVVSGGDGPLRLRRVTVTLTWRLAGRGGRPSHTGPARQGAGRSVGAAP